MKMVYKNLALILVVGLLASCGSKLADTDESLGQKTNLKGVAAVDHFIDFITANGMVDKADPNWKLKLTEPDLVEFDLSKKIYWLLETNKGEIKVELLPDTAPMHVTSTIYLTRLGFYEDLSFHRIITGFMMQGGCPKGDGTGFPGYRISGEYNRGEKHHSRGIVSAANIGAPNTDGSQFFITFRATPGLNGKHTVFGRVVEGESTIIKVERQATPDGVPRRAITIKKATIIEE